MAKEYTQCASKCDTFLHLHARCDVHIKICAAVLLSCRGDAITHPYLNLLWKKGLVTASHEKITTKNWKAIVQNS